MFDLEGYGILSLFLVAFAVNLLPFTSPSNLFIAFNFALLTPVQPLAVGFLVASAASAAKLLHYYVVFFLRSAMGASRRASLERLGSALGRWSLLAVVVAAVTPIPDDPVILPLGLLKYSPLKLALGYFAGKMAVASVGGYLGKVGVAVFQPLVGGTALMAVSLALTVAAAVVLVKVNPEELLRRLKRPPAGRGEKA
ncbi:hypothetical protein [Candidatus Hecatella orcuttiae]|uniref:hypothetical protein n=1 Tax=Candidatus Hecatella orcuttiae TaxID=1935119 RepID=UPI002867EF79|nr:hypothetical protein [Candidatus Hecatella orcuttiae]